MKSNFIILIVPFLIPLFITSCKSSSDRSESKSSQLQVSVETQSSEGDWLIYHIGAEPATLNPITGTDVYESMIDSGNVYETLVKRDNATLDLVPLLAESWKISDDKLTYTFHIRKGIKWQDGVPFTSQDVVFSYSKIMDPQVDAPHLRNYYKDIKSVEAVDELTVKFTYSRPYFLALEFCGGMPIVPKHIFEKGDFNTNEAGRHPIGTGPYRFVNWNTGREIVLQKNQDYWGEKPHLDRIVFRIINDPTVAFQVLKREELDLMALTPIQWSRQSDTENFSRKFDKLSYFTPNYSFIGWNTRKPYFSDKRVRIAMTHLVNRELILEKILFNLGTIVTNPFYINSPEYDKTIEPYSYDPGKAKALLDQAGWVDHDGDGIRDKDGVKFEFEFLIPNGSETGDKISTILKDELDKVGIVMNIRNTEWAVFTTRLNERKFDAVTLGWSMGVENDPYQIWHSSQIEQGSNFVGFANKEADNLIDAARIEFDRDKRIELYRKFSEIVHEEQPYTFLFCRESTVALNKRFKGVVVYPLGLDPREWFVPPLLRKYEQEAALSP
jgi:peptide/nickel transport system substrate-binding protein